MLQHSLYNCTGSFSMMIYFFRIECNIAGNSFYFFQVTFLCLSFNSFSNSPLTSEKLFTKQSPCESLCMQPVLWPLLLLHIFRLPDNFSIAFFMLSVQFPV